MVEMGGLEPPTPYMRSKGFPDPADRDLHARELLDEAAARRPDRDHPPARAAGGDRARRPRAVRLYPIYHPAAALYTPRMLETLREDFARLPELLGARPAAAASRRLPPPEPGERCSPSRRRRPVPHGGRRAAAAEPRLAERRPARPVLGRSARPVQTYVQPRPDGKPLQRRDFPGMRRKNCRPGPKVVAQAADEDPVSIPPGVNDRPAPHSPAGRSFLTAEAAARGQALESRGWPCAACETAGPAGDRIARRASSQRGLRDGRRRARARRARRRQDDARARRRAGARRRRPRDEPHLQRSATATAARDVTVSHLDLYRLAGLERRGARRCWPTTSARAGSRSSSGRRSGEGELAGARLRVTLSHGGGDRARGRARGACDGGERGSAA